MVRAIEPGDMIRITAIEAAADQLLVERFGPELFGDVTAAEDRVAEPGFVLVERGSAHLQQVAVDPAHGQRGIGTALVRACCERARQGGYDELTLTTFRDVDFNAPWYARLGFEIIEDPVGAVARHVEQEQPYARLSPRVAMSRRLDGPTAAESPADPTRDQ